MNHTPDISAKAAAYLNAEQHPAFRAEVAQLLAEGNSDELFDRFYTMLAFGTGGMRGLIGGGTNRINPYMVARVTQGFAAYMKSMEKNPVVVIAYDSRNYSKEFATEAARVLCANKVRVYLFSELTPVPILSYAVRMLRATAGIVITASHNPAVYNGYKVYWSNGAQVTPPHDEGITAKVQETGDGDILRMGLEEATACGLLTAVPLQVKQSYINEVLASAIHPDAMKAFQGTVVYTPLHGSGNIPVRQLLDSIGITYEVVKEQELPDGNFPTVSMPNPESPDAMEKAIQLAKEKKADIVLGTDPDADRLGIAIPANEEKTEYLMLTGNQIAVLFTDYMFTAGAGFTQKTPLCVKSLVTTDLVRRIAERHGGICRDVLTGFKYIAEQMEAASLVGSDEKFVFGCEESYGYLSVSFVRDKDAVSSAMRAVEMASWYALQGKTLKDRLDEIYQEYGYATEAVFSKEYHGAAGKQEMSEIMASYRGKRPGDNLFGLVVLSVEDLLNQGDRAQFPLSDVVIVRFTDGTKLVVRPSGTEPKIKYYLFLAGKREETQVISKRFKEELA